MLKPTNPVSIYRLKKRPKILEIYKFMCENKESIIGKSLKDVYDEVKRFYNASYKTFYKYHMSFLIKHGFVKVEFRGREGLVVLDLIEVEI